MTDIILSYDEAINLERQHVKHELMDYRHYCARVEYLTDKIARIDHKLNGDLSAAAICSSGGSFVSANNSWITTAMAEQEELQRELDMATYHVDLVEGYLAKLNDEHYEAINLYVISNNCTKLEESAESLGYKTKRALLKTIEAAITEILEKN